MNLDQFFKLFPRSQGELIESGCTEYVYCLLRKDEVVYVGITNNVGKRIREHRQEKRFDSYLIHSWHKDRMYAAMLESTIIKAVRPQLNIAAGVKLPGSEIAVAGPDSLCRNCGKRYSSKSLYASRKFCGAKCRDDYQQKKGR